MKKVALVTGAASGIGLATAKRLLQAQMQVVGMARRPDMENLGADFTYVSGDLGCGEDRQLNQVGLVSVSFRKLTPEEILRRAAEAGLEVIEWGSDIHAPRLDPGRLQELVQLQRSYGIRCCSYGTYFYLGRDPVEQLPEYIAAAKVLGTDVLRLWCGVKSPWGYTQQEKQALFAACREAAEMAEKAGVTLCMECHMRSFTETRESALELMRAVSSPAFRMYWQPNQNRTAEENIAYIGALKEYIEHIHVFQWKGTEKLPLEQGAEEWKKYLAALPAGRTLLLEFMPDNDIASLAREAKTLQKLRGACI